MRHIGFNRFEKRLALQADLSDDIGLAALVTRERQLIAALSDEDGLAQAIFRQRFLSASLADDTGLTATITRRRALIAALSDDIGLSATLTQSRFLSAALADDVGLAATISITQNFPLWVNQGTISRVTASSVTPALPASRVNGNLLIAVAFAQTSGAGAGEGISFPGTGGWTVGDTIAAGPSQVGAWCWRIIDGTEVAPVASRVGSHTHFFIAAITQFSGVNASSPIGNHNQVTANALPLTCAAMTTTNNSSKLWHVYGNANTAVSPFFTDPQFTTLLHDNDNATEAWGSDGMNIATSGGGNTAFNGGSSAGLRWSAFLIEIKGP